MKKFSQEEIDRILPLLLGDEDRRRIKRLGFDHANDVLAENCVVPFSIWPNPNDDAARILRGEIIYGSLSFEIQNEVEKGLFFPDQAEFAGAHQGIPLCEVLEYRPCLGCRCPMHCQMMCESLGLLVGICREYKLAFKK